MKQKLKVKGREFKLDADGEVVEAQGAVDEQAATVDSLSAKLQAAEEAADLIPNGATIGFSGFTPAGSAKAIPKALAARAERDKDPIAKAPAASATISQLPPIQRPGLLSRFEFLGGI